MHQAQNQNQDDPYKISLPKFDISVYSAGDKIGSDPAAILKTAGVSEGEAVADFGCGVGFFVMEVSKIVGIAGKVFAIDINKELLDSLKGKAIDSGRRNIYGIRADLEKPGSTGLDDGSVDVVLVINILFLSKNREAILAEARRVLKPGGKLVIMDWSEKRQHVAIEKEQIVSAKEIKELTRKLDFKKLKIFEAGLAHEVSVFTKS